MENLEYLEKKAYSSKKNKNLDALPLFFNSEELDFLSKRSIAIVGTNGKTSTATLIFAYIKYFEKDVVKFKNRVNPEIYNGASLIGLNGISIKSHGSASPFAFNHALKKCYKSITNDLNKKIVNSMQNL